MRILVLFLVIINLLGTIFLGYIIWDKGLLGEQPSPLPAATPAGPAPSSEVPANTPPAPPPIYVDITSSGTDVTMLTGGELHVSLDIASSQDYVWALEENASTILEFISSSGNVTSQNWVFQAKNKGTGVLKMVYGKIVEGTMQSTEKSFSLNLSVE
jgi:predicted secreted protein